jgi:catechol 2,3-dioxygenase-like lactoylglutathione lyase family enzyme
MNKNRVIQGVGVHHIAVQARDWEISRHFYESILGMPFVTEFETATEKFAFFEIGNGSTIELFHPLADTPKPNSPAANDPVTHFALTTSNLHEVIARVREAGYTITEEPFDIIIGTWDATIAFFTGPNGESIELFQLNRTITG